MAYSNEPHTRENHPKGGYILVDFDSTLATYTSWSAQGPNLGAPIPAMVERVKRWLAAGEEVRIFTARAAPNNPRVRVDTPAIQDWCRTHLGQALEVTNQKDFGCKALWDDIAVTVERNTGWRWTADALDPLAYEEEMVMTKYAIDTFSPRPKIEDEELEG